MKKTMLSVVLALFLVFSLGTAASASDFDFNGTFSYGYDVASFKFTINESSTVTLFTSSYAQGGFDPYLTLWTGSGAYIEGNDDDGDESIDYGYSNGNRYLIGLFDAYVLWELSAGDYIVTLTQFGNSANSDSLGGGFFEDNNPEFDFSGRDAAFRIHIVNVAEAVQLGDGAAPAPVPAPATLILFGTGLLGAFGVSRKKRLK